MNLEDPRSYLPSLGNINLFFDPLHVCWILLTLNIIKEQVRSFELFWQLNWWTLTDWLENSF